MRKLIGAVILDGCFAAGRVIGAVLAGMERSLR